MLIRVFIETLFGLVASIMDYLPEFPTLNLFETLDTSEFTQTALSA